MSELVELNAAIAAAVYGPLVDRLAIGLFTAAGMIAAGLVLAAVIRSSGR